MTLVMLVRAANPSTIATLKSMLVLDPAFKVTALGDVRSLIATSLTAVSLAALTKLELAFGLVLIAIASGLVLALGFVERNRTYAILRALGASTGQLGFFLNMDSRTRHSLIPCIVCRRNENGRAPAIAIPEVKNLITPASWSSRETLHSFS
jgi:hypothetical protein